MTLRQVWQDFARVEGCQPSGFSYQLRTSVASNIAEGCGRDGEKERCRFFSIAAGSASELEYQLLLAHDLEYLSRDAYLALNEQVAEVKRMLYRFMQSLNSTS